MTLQDLGAIGELVGAVAVFASLIYLAMQIRQNTAMITAQTVQAAVDATQRVLLQRAQDPALRAMLRKARANAPLDPDEYEMLASYLQAVFMNFQARLQHNVRGVFDASVNESYELILADYLYQPYVRRWWEFSRPLYGTDFRAHCDAVIAGFDRGDKPPVANWAQAPQLEARRRDRPG